MRKTNNKEYIYLSIRYLILLTSMFTLPIFHKIFSPLTIYSVTKILSRFYQISLNQNLILINNLTLIEIIPACIAGSAYLFFLILNLSIQMNPKKRIYTILFAFSSLFILNIFRIIILTIIVTNNPSLFDLTHKLFWYILSTILVIVIWFLTIKLFSIKEIPLISDVKFIIKNIKK